MQLPSASDDFERAQLGPDWTVRFPVPDSDNQVQIIDSTSLGLGPGAQGFFLVNWAADAFAADQYCEANIATDTIAAWAHMVHVRWRSSDNARYGFAYNSDAGQATIGQWIFKYDGVPSAQTRIIASAVGAAPVPGDTIRLVRRQSKHPEPGQSLGFLRRGRALAFHTGSQKNHPEKYAHSVEYHGSARQCTLHSWL